LHHFQDLAPWNGAVPSHPPSVESDTGWCPVAGPDGKPSGQNGQSCFWFSNGCAIGCSACDGTSRGPIPSSRNPLNVRKFNWCPDGTNSTAKATICDKALRTVNRGVDCGAADDWYYYSPWRYDLSSFLPDTRSLTSYHLRSGPLALHLYSILAAWQVGTSPRMAATAASM
jgi:hypothetical protein